MDPESLVGHIRDFPGSVTAAGLEAGPLSQWLRKGLRDAGLETVLTETKRMKSKLKSARTGPDYCRSVCRYGRNSMSQALPRQRNSKENHAARSEFESSGLEDLGQASDINCEIRRPGTYSAAPARSPLCCCAETRRQANRPAGCRADRNDNPACGLRCQAAAAASSDTMRPSTSRLVASAVLRMPEQRPFRITITRSAMANTWSRL